MSSGNPGFLGVPETAVDQKEHLRRVARAINGVLQGKLNALATVTLTANSAATTFSDPRITSNSFLGFMPTTANAAAALAGLYVSATQAPTGTMTAGTATLNHANNAQVDKTFKVLIIG